jgi:hypothetical protein
MHYEKDSALQKTALTTFVEENCHYFLSDECHGSLVGKCIGGDVNGGRLKRESQTAVIYQYPYEFTYPNAGLCWVQEGITCDYFERFVLLGNGNKAIAKEYEKCVSGIVKQEPRFGECGNILSGNERKCIICKRKTRRLRNRKFRGSR